MKSALVFLACALLCTQCYATSVSPVTRVVELLKALAAQTEKEGKAEEDLYDTYVCWSKKVISEKTASNEVAKSRIDELEAYIADLDSGRIELSSERTDLEKEIAGLMSDMESATANRKKENADFQSAEAEMKKAIKALKSAMDTLGTATKNHTKGVLLAVRARLHNAAKNGGMEELAEHQASLKQAAELGERFLAKADATFLKRVLLGDVPKVNWKKLNRKANFKMSYKARSFKIQGVLKKMHQSFKTNLADATKKEGAAKSQYDTLIKAKQDLLDAAQKALTKMATENGAKGMSKKASQDEVKALKKQVKDDTKFIGQTQTALADKQKAWKKRSDLRAGELAAISKAISILHNDDARDLFKKSFASQGFLQVASTSKVARRAEEATAALRDAASRSGDERLLALAGAPFKSVKGKFAPILKAIDKMIKQLKAEEDKDLDMKQTCESDRMKDTREAAATSRDIDEATDLITALTAEIAQCQKKIADLKSDHKKANEALKKAQKMRNAENAEWKKTDADDKAAAETVLSAKKVLEGFYKDNGLSLAQTSAPGAAPPPPPPTWEADYGGNTGESQGIISIMQMVYEDIKKDRADGKADEDKAQKEFDAFKKDSEAKMKALNAQKKATEKKMGDAETKKVSTKKIRGTNKGKLNVVLGKIESVNPNCEYYMVNYPMRRKNRQLEIDGLNKAKTILKGGTFTAGPDPNRAIKPGDAFLQKRF